MHQPLPVPLYQRVFGVLHQRIRSGVYQAGQRLPTEQDFVAEFGVSKATIRQAVGELVARGLVVRQQGRGTYVSDNTGADGDDRFVGSLTDLILGTPQLPLHDVRVEHEIPFPHTVRTRLAVASPTGKVIRTRRILRGALFVYSVHYLSPAIADLVTAEALGDAGLVSLLHRRGIAVRGAEQSIAAELAEAEVADALQLDIGAATLAARRVLRTDDGDVEVLHSWYRGDLYEWQTALRFRWQGDRMTVLSSGATELVGG